MNPGLRHVTYAVGTLRNCRDNFLDSLRLYGSRVLLMASYIRNIRTKNYNNWITLLTL